MYRYLHEYAQCNPTTFELAVQCKLEFTFAFGELPIPESLPQLMHSVRTDPSLTESEFATKLEAIASNDLTPLSTDPLSIALFDLFKKALQGSESTDKQPYYSTLKKEWKPFSTRVLLVKMYELSRDRNQLGGLVHQLCTSWHNFTYSSNPPLLTLFATAQLAGDKINEDVWIDALMDCLHSAPSETQ